MMKLKVISKTENKRTYVKESRKRKKITIEYNDGTVESFDEGIVITVNKDNKGITCKHLNTHNNIGFYGHAMGEIALDMMNKAEEFDLER